MHECSWTRSSNPLSMLCYDDKLSRHGFIIASGARLWMNDLILCNRRSVVINMKSK